MTDYLSPEQHANKGSFPELDMKVELVVNDRAEAMVFHNKPFSKRMSWLEYDLDESRLDFIMNDGDIRNFGIKIHPNLAKYLQNSFQVLMVLMDGDTGEPIEGEYFPIIIHRA